MLGVTSLCERISYIKSSENPLSADVGMVEGERFLWLFDVGNNPDVTAFLNGINRPKNAVLSHFHADHIGGLKNLDCNTVYLGARTLKYTGLGEVVHGDLYIDDGIKLHIFELPSSHASGSIGLEVGDYAFLGDGTYATVKNDAVVYNSGLLQAEIAKLNSLSARYFLLSHNDRYAVPRDEVIADLERIYARRKKNEAYIAAE